MHFTDPLLQEVRIAAPCQAEWRWMYGDGRVRFCGQCNLNVYNLSAMTSEEAEDLIRRTEGRLCARFYRRKDGTILIKNCPVGVRSFKEKLTSARTTIILAILTFMAYLGVLWWFNRLGMARLPLMGDIALPDSTTEIPLVERSEQFIREKAVLKVTPFFHTISANQSKGRVVVRVLISSSGDVISAALIEGNPALKATAEEAARLAVRAATWSSALAISFSVWLGGLKPG